MCAKDVPESLGMHLILYGKFDILLPELYIYSQEV